MVSEKVIAIATAVVLMAAATGNVDKLQMWVWRAQAQLVKESRTSNWGSPRFFPDRRFTMKASKTFQSRSLEYGKSDLDK